MRFSPATHSVPGSERDPLEGAGPLAPADTSQQIEVTVVVRPRPGAMRPLIVEAAPLSRHAYAAQYGADPVDLALVEAFAHHHGLDVARASVAERLIVLAGAVGAFQDAFGVELTRYSAPDGEAYRGRTGPVRVPLELADVVTAVLGLDDRPQAQPHFLSVPAAAAATGYTPLEVATLYSYPPNTDGTGQCIALIELGGGYRASDLDTYFASLGVVTPAVSAVAVAGGRNQPTGQPQGPDGEVMLDIEVAGAIAPGARIAVYFAPNTDAGFLQAISAAAHDSLRTPSVISISWGGPESSWTAQSLRAYDDAFQAAAAMGVTVCCACGDHGSSDGLPDGLAHVDFPASSPHVLACGGTALRGAAGTITAESVWNDGPPGPTGWATGGGVSDVFDLPTWQATAGVPPSANSPGTRGGRGVPDVSGDASQPTGYRVLVDGQEGVSGGTSAVAPLWAALIARLNQQRGAPLDLPHPLFYALPAAGGAFHDITDGDNGAYHAAPGWDPCTGLGSPNGAALLAALPTTAPPATGA